MGRKKKVQINESNGGVKSALTLWKGVSKLPMANPNPSGGRPAQKIPFSERKKKIEVLHQLDQLLETLGEANESEKKS